MKKLLSAIAISVIALSATAQEKRESPAPKEHMGQGMHKKDHHGNNRHMMMKALNFSEAQKSQLKANREAYRTKVDALKKNQNISLKVYNEKKSALDKEQKEKMLSLLTPEQKTKMAEIKAKSEADRVAKTNKRFETMKSKLSLTDDQASKWQAQDESVQANRKAIMNNESLSRESKRDQMKALKETSQKDRKSILTADQVKKLEDMKKQRQPKDWKKTKS
ncbi:hypothetical protein BH11BAC4_BH11BAC4_24420 [soil metagenome]